MSGSGSHRRWSRGLRWAVLSAAALLSAGVLLVAPGAVSRSVPSAGADNCPDVALTFACLLLETEAINIKISIKTANGLQGRKGRHSVEV